MIKTETEIREQWLDLPFVRAFYEFKGGKEDMETIADYWLSLLRQDREELKKAIEGKKYTFKEVTWGVGITSIEPVEDETKCLEYAKGFNEGMDMAVSLLQSKHESKTIN